MQWFNCNMGLKKINGSPLPLILLPLTFSTISIRQTLESPCLRQQQEYKPEDIQTDAIHSWCQIHFCGINIISRIFVEKR